jgi:hypothetical protein
LKDANEKVWNYDFTLILPSGRFSVCFPETRSNRKRGGKINLLLPDQIRRMEIGYIVPRIILVMRSTEMEKYYRFCSYWLQAAKKQALKDHAHYTIQELRKLEFQAHASWLEPLPET